MTWIEWGQTLLLVAGASFYVIGTIGVLRFPDVFTRVHALTKADNIGLGLLVIGLLPSAGSVSEGFKLLLIWTVVLAGSATSGQLIARRARERGVVPWSARDKR